MREHPIPQDIVGYRFHIVGSMTLKQFGELAAGAILGLIIYSTNLPTPIKWGLIFFAVAIGAAAAFLPIAERPLDHWITTFFKTLYQPTKFFWEKSSKIPDLFLFKAGQEAMDTKDEIDLSPARRKRIKDYLASVKSGKRNLDQYDLDLQDRVGQIMKSFEEVIPNKIEAKKQNTKPNLQVRARSLTNSSIFEDEIIIYDKSKKVRDKTILEAQQVAKSVSVPEVEAVEVNIHQASEEIDNSDVEQQAVYVETDEAETAEEISNEQSAVFNAALPFPSKPKQPNKLVGMILTSNNELIPEAIVEIKDDQNRVVRAVKSNALGQFFISTPLKNGNYSIFLEHSTYQFHPQEIILEGERVDPIEIRSLS